MGQTLKKYDRKSYFLITKLCNTDQYNGNIREGFEQSLKALGTDYVDLYLMHWPVTNHFIDSWKEMEKIYKEGKCKAIGVCNFSIHHLEELKKYATILPMVNEIECHPLFTQNELREYCHDNGIQALFSMMVFHSIRQHSRRDSSLQRVSQWHISMAAGQR